MASDACSCCLCCTGVLVAVMWLQALVANGVSLSLKDAVAVTAAQQPIPVSTQQQEAVLEFVGRRLEQLLVDAGVSPEAGELPAIAVEAHGGHSQA
jgi:hypothetical protein